MTRSLSGKILALLAVLAVGATAFAAEPLVVRGGSEEGFRPYAFVDSSGQPAGFGPELLRAVASRAGLDLQVTHGPWDKVWAELVAGELDVLPVVARSPSREPLVDFSLPHTQSFDAFFVREGRPPIPSLATAAGREIVVLRSDAAQHHLEERKFSGKIVPVDSISEGLRLIAAGQHDALLCSKVVGVLEREQAGIEGIEAGPPIPDYKRVFSFAVPKGNTELLERLNQGLAIVKADGTYDQLYERWLDVHEPRYSWLPLLLWTAGALVVLAILVVVVLQLLVNRRTRQLRELTATLEARVAERTAALREANERYELVLAGAEAGIWDWDVPGHRVVFSSRWKAMRGLMEGEVTDAEAEWSSRIHPADAPRVMAAVAAHFEGRTPVFAAEYRVRRKDGSWIWVADRGIARRDGNGRVLRMAGSETDITGRKQAEVALRESEERFRAIANYSYDWESWIGVDGKPMWINPAVKRLAGVSPEECMRMDDYPLPLVHPDDRERMRELLAQALAGIAGNDVTFRIRRPDGTEVWGAISWQPIAAADGTALGCRSSVRDITDRKHAEAAMKSHHELLETVFEYMPAAINIIRGSDLRLIMANPGYRTLAPGKGDPVGRTLDELWPETGQDFASLCRRVLETGEPHHAVDELNMIRRTPDGPLERAWFTWSLYRIRLPGEAGWGIFNPAWETTGRMRAEERLREADRRKDEFLATLAHELRNPLAPLRTGLDVIQLLRGDDVACQKPLEIMDRQLNYLVRLVDDLLDVSRISRGKIQLQQERLDLAQIIGAALEMSDSALRRGGRHLTVTVPPESLPVEGDRVRLVQVLANLLNNAAKFTANGGHISVRVVTGRDRVEIQVQDDGRGISPEQLIGVFELFGQAEPGRDGGLGIGLTLVKTLVEMHGGTVVADSEGLGCGATFTVSLPLCRSTAEQAASPKGAEIESFQPQCRVLVVDDNPDVAEGLRLLLTTMKADARVAHDGKEALRIFAEWQPTHVLMDLGMPGMDGYETARRLCANHPDRAFRLVAISGWGQDTDRQQAREAGFDAHLVKPVGVADLKDILASQKLS